MIKIKTILGALLVAAAFAVPVAAQETTTPAAEPAVAEPAAAEPAAAEASSHATPQIEKQNWTFGGVFGTFDEHQLQRGFQVFREICASCHSARLLAFRNLSEEGGPGFSEAQVKALAATYEIADPDAEAGKRPGIAADHWPSPFANDRDARDANGGALPPDLSVIAKARGTTQPFPWWILNYFTAYSEGGPDYIHALLNGYHEEAPAGFELPEGKYYNEVFPGHSIGMPPPLQDGLVTYETGANGETVPATVEQYSQDVSAFLMWVAEPHLVDRKETGFKVMAFLFLFAVLMYLVKRKLWSRVEH
jgi:ubiquinol-cytochrome c reductase cytochrome c1 subunit